jgi:hypothetical protein
VVASLAFWPVVSGARSFFHLDLRYEIVPLWEVSRRAILAGESPFWIEGEYCGHPALLRQEVALFYPLTIPLLLTGAPANRLSDLFSLFHFWLAGFAAYLLLSDVTASNRAGLFGGVAWMLSARQVQSALWPNSLAVSALLPLLLLGVLRIGRGQRRSGILFASISGGLALLAFRPQVLVGATPALLAVAIAAVGTAASRRRAFFDLLLAALLALALGAPAILPSAALYPLSSRAGGLSGADRDLRPIAFDRDLDQVFLPVDGVPRWPEPAAYPGVLAGVLFLAGIGLAARGDPGFPRALFFALALGGAVGLVFAFGEKGPYGLLAGLPVLREFRIPARYVVSWSLAVALGSALVAGHVIRRSARAAGLSAVGVVLLVADLVWHARRAAPTAPADVYSAEPAVVSAMRERLSVDEVGFRHRFWSLAPHINLLAYPDAEKAAVARGFEPLSFAIGMRYGLESVLGQQGPSLRRSDVLFQKPTRRAAELGGVGLLVTSEPAPPGTTHPPPRLVLESFSPLPRAILVPEAVAIPASKAVAAALDPAFEPRRVALLEGDAALSRAPGWSSEKASVRLLSRGPGRIELAASLPAEAILVLFNSFEKGWRAAVDGSPVPVFRADAAFLGIRVPAGPHRVRFEYRPRGLREGLGLGAAGILGLLLSTMRLPAG